MQKYITLPRVQHAETDTHNQHNEFPCAEGGLVNESDEKAAGSGIIDNLILLVTTQGESLRAAWMR